MMKKALIALLAALGLTMVMTTPANADWLWGEESNAHGCGGASGTVWSWIAWQDNNTEQNISDDVFDMGPRNDSDDVTMSFWEWRLAPPDYEELELYNIDNEIRWADIWIEKRQGAAGAGEYINHWHEHWGVNGKDNYGLPHTNIDRDKEPRVKVEVKLEDKNSCIYKVAWFNVWE